VNPRRLELSVALLLLFSSAIWAQTANNTFNLADATVAPTRIVLEGKDRTAEVTLMNRSNKTLTYALKLVNFRMTETGEMESVDKAAEGEYFADSMIRFTPRRVVFEPNQAQVVRLQLRKPQDLAPGEYRSHLVFQVVPNTSLGGESETMSASSENASTENGIGIKLIPVYGVSIPIIVREGDTFAKVEMTNLELLQDEKTGSPEIRFDLLRSGNQSVYGDIEVACIQKGHQPVVLGLVKGIAVYTPNSRRIVTIPLRLPEGLKLEGSTLKVTYTDSYTKTKGTNPILASGSLSLQ
jgi:hypothetical protein